MLLCSARLIWLLSLNKSLQIQRAAANNEYGVIADHYRVEQDVDFSLP